MELRTVRVHPRVFCPRRSGLVGATIRDGRYAEKIILEISLNDIKMIVILTGELSKMLKTQRSNQGE